jgi:hydrogenase maturation protease
MVHSVPSFEKEKYHYYAYTKGSNKPVAALKQLREGEWTEGLSRCLRASAARKHLLGVGNPIGRDDAVGLRIVSMLRRKYGSRPRGDVLIHPPLVHQERLLSRLGGEGGALVIFDAVECNMVPGEILCARLSETNFGFFATHNLPMRLMPGVASSMASAWVVGVQPEEMGVGEELSETVRRSAEEIVEAVGRVLEGEHGPA